MDANARMEEFKKGAMPLMDRSGFRKPVGFGIHRVQRNANGEVIATRFPLINWGCNTLSAAIILEGLGLLNNNLSQNELTVPVSKCNLKKMSEIYSPILQDSFGPHHKNVQLVKALTKQQDKGLDDIYATFLFDDQPVTSLAAAYLKLGAISTRQAKPLTLNLDGAFGILPTVGWRNGKAHDLEELSHQGWMDAANGDFTPMDYTDKFPRLMDMMHIIDPNIRVLSSHNVRYGAHLGSGSVVMPGASYINFDSGTLGQVMNEGRISSKATVGHMSDIGGGASILGTLSGGNNMPISVGECCLLGANSITGIPLGDECTVAAGVALMAGSKLLIPQTDVEALIKANPTLKTQIQPHAARIATDPSETIKAKYLSGANRLLVMQDSQTGQMLARYNTNPIRLNSDLHGNANQTTPPTSANPGPLPKPS